MTQKIIYQTKDGIAIIHPTGEIPFEEVCRKDVPAGVPYIIVDESEIPTDRTFRSAWEADTSNPDGHGIGSQAWFIEQFNKEILSINQEPEPVKSEEQTDEEHSFVVAEWNKFKAARIEQLNKMIAIQEAEMAA